MTTEPLTNEKLESLREIHRIHGTHGVWNYNAYMMGMFNGLECALATLEDREPSFRVKPSEGWMSERNFPKWTQQSVDAWNLKTPIGSTVILTLDEGDSIVTTTRSPAWLLASGHAVVKLNAKTGGWSLDRITVTDNQFKP